MSGAALTRTPGSWAPPRAQRLQLTGSWGHGWLGLGGPLGGVRVLIVGCGGGGGGWGLTVLCSWTLAAAQLLHDHEGPWPLSLSFLLRQMEALTRAQKGYLRLELPA